MAEGFRGLLVWQRAMELVEAIYCATEPFPRAEDYALKSQLRRAAVSVPSNIAEGSGRGTKRDFQGYLRIAKGSLREASTQVEIAERVGYLERAQASTLQDQIGSVGKLLTNLIASLDPTV